MKNLFDKIIDRRETNSVKWDRYQNPDVLPMWVADMDFQTSPAIREAMTQHIHHGIFGYTHASDDLNDTIVKRFSKMYSWPIKSNWISWLPGVVPGLHATCYAFSDPGDDIITFTPIYPPFLHMGALTGRRLVCVPLAEQNGQTRIDLEQFKKTITLRSRVLLLSQPHNPTGRIFKPDELKEIIKICHENNIIICSDEIHCDLILDHQQHHPVASLDPLAQNITVTLMSPGKTFNTAGLNCGFAIIPDNTLRKKFKKCHRDLLPYPNALALTACLAAYRDSADWHQELLNVLRRNAGLLHDGISQHDKLKMTLPQATYLAWIDARSIDTDDSYQYFLKKGLGLSNGKDFGAPGFVRLNFACPLSRLEQAIKKLNKS